MKKTSNKKKFKVSQLPVPFTVELPAAASVFDQTSKPSSSSEGMISVDAQSYLSLGKVRHKLKTGSKLFTPQKSFLNPSPEESPAKADNTIIDYNIPSPVDVFETELVEENEDSYNEGDSILKLDDTGMITEYALGKLKIVEDFDGNDHVDEIVTHNAEEETEEDEKENQGDEGNKDKDQKEDQDPLMQEAGDNDKDQREEQEAQKQEDMKEIELKEPKAWLGQTFGSSCCIS